MEQQSVIHSTFVIERSFAKPPERVFSAFADATKKRRWFADPETSEIEEFGMDFRVGGTERLRYRFKEGTPLTGSGADERRTFSGDYPGAADCHRFNDGAWRKAHLGFPGDD